MSDPTKPPPRPPGPLDHEDPPDDVRPKSPKAPKRPAYKPGAEPKPWPSSQRSETPHKGATLGWADEPVAPGDYAEIIRRAVRLPGEIEWKDESSEHSDIQPTLIINVRRPQDGDLIHPEHDDAEPRHACMAEEEE